MIINQMIIRTPSIRSQRQTGSHVQSCWCVQMSERKVLESVYFFFTGRVGVVTTYFRRSFLSRRLISLQERLSTTHIPPHKHTNSLEGSKLKKELYILMFTFSNVRNGKVGGNYGLTCFVKTVIFFLDQVIGQNVLYSQTDGDPVTFSKVCTFIHCINTIKLEVKKNFGLEMKNLIYHIELIHLRSLKTSILYSEKWVVEVEVVRLAGVGTSNSNLV